ncbi:MAG: hypothetical protein U1E24_06820 [Phenylobacterium sp.]|nr:hypothetical protein [Phenylobacterium sp.]
MLVGLPAAATAAPLIIADNVAAKCTILPDGTAATVTVTLNNTTYNFYGQSLVFHFTPNTTGAPQAIPMPAGSTKAVTLPVSPGVYTLRISNQTAPGGNTSVNYNVTVPAGMVSSLGPRKMCLDREVKENRRVNQVREARPPGGQ